MPLKHTLAGTCIGLFVCAAASAQSNYPSRPITMTIPFAAGGPMDSVGRPIAQFMSKVLRHQVIVDNVGGAGGTIGTARVAKSEPDGHTILLHHIGHATSASLYRKLSYDPLNDFEPIGLVAEVPMTFVARNSFPPKDAKELLVYVKANKDKVSLANAGVGSASHLCGMMFMSSISTDLVTVSYKGTGPAMNDLLGEQIDLMCDLSTNVMSHAKAGKIKAYATTARDRNPLQPNIPSMRETGLPNVEVVVWYGLYAPKNTPRTAIDKLSAALRSVVSDADLRQRFTDMGATLVPEQRATPEALRAHLKSEIERWAPVIRNAGIYAD